MAATETMLTINYSQSGETCEAGLSALGDAVIGFLDHLGVAQFVGAEFAEIIGPGDGASRFQRLLEACGYGADPGGFFARLLELLGKADGSGELSLGGVRLPRPLLMAVLELVLPGNRFISVKTVEQLEKLSNRAVPETDREAMQKVLETYPVRLSMHTIRQMRLSSQVAYQYLPFVEELDPVGHTNTWIGQFHQGLLEQMYQNRVIFLLNMSCPVYCRFCFRKHKESRNETNPGPEEVRRAVEHVRNSPAIKEVVVTGGDPFMNRANLAATIDGLLAIEHVQTLRLATRSIAYYPHLFLGEEAALLGYLKRTQLELRSCGKRLEIATHFIHPDEISVQSLEIITELVGNGIAVYVQTPFLNGCNDQGPELVRLFSLLRGAGAELHYIYIPCSPIHGNRVYWAPISRGLEVANHLRAHLSDRVMPRICTATPIGKIDWFTSGWAVEPVAENENFIWIRSPYTPDYFKEFAPIANELENIRINEEGTIDIQYMADIGDQSLLVGSRPLRLGGGVREPADKAEIMPQLLAGDRRGHSIVETGAAGVSRVHETRVELDCRCGAAELDYIRGQNGITDVVVYGDTDIVHSLENLRRIVGLLRSAPQVNAVRLRSLSFNYRPQRYTAAALDLLGSLNRLSIAEPLRLEVETQFLEAEEIGPDHDRLTRLLNNRGITVYNNTPLLGGINDNPDAINRLAFRCRQAGIEFHQLYVAGCPLQEFWNRDHPVSLYDVVDIATRVRREGSGREVPRYIIRTILGEVDFGLGSRFSESHDALQVTLLPYDLGYYRAMAPEFEWPDGVDLDPFGRPMLPVTGLIKTTDFPFS